MTSRKPSGPRPPTQGRQLRVTVLRTALHEAGYLIEGVPA